jgi:calcineurin-like phosphoesterase family protein
MRTLVVSDLHLGTRSGADVLRRPVGLQALVGALDGVDRLVLLGDVLELRQSPLRDAMAAAQPVMRALGAALGAGAEVVIVAGNHDHRLIGPWLDARGRDTPPAPLELEQRPGTDASPALAQLAAWLAPATVDVAYPGLWLRDDVYATHGHYLDRHTTLPTFERIGAGIMGRLVGAVPEPATPDDYEAALAPLYAWMDSLAERAPADRGAATQGSVGIWSLLTGDGHRPLRGRLLLGMLPIGIGTLNRLGLGPVKSDLSAHEVWSAGVRAMAQTVDRLAIEAEHVIFGHTHRCGPFPQDDSLEWTFTGGGRLINSGCWVYEPAFLSRGRSSPFWPGAAVQLDDESDPPTPPRVVRLLGDVDPDALRAPDR